MSLKAELETWAAALKAYDDEDFDKSIELFSTISDSSKILTNMGLIYATLGEHEAAVEQFNAAIQLDQYLAVAYFQSGVSNFLLARYPNALDDFADALLYLRGNPSIEYAQLGLKFTLYAAEVLFNKGLCHIYQGRAEIDRGERDGQVEIGMGMKELQEAQKEKVTDEHNVIDDAIRENAEGYTVFSIPVGVLYRPSDKKLQNAKTKDYMGKAKLVAAEDASEAFTEFTGAARMKMGISPTGSTEFISGGLTRAVTVANPAPPPKAQEGIDRPRIQRANTTINVPDRSRSVPSSPAGADSPGLSRPPASAVPARSPSTRLARSGTTIGSGSGRMPVPPTRGLSIRKPGPTMDAAQLPRGMRTTTEFYDTYLNSYSDDPLSPVAEQPITMARSNTARRAPQRSQSTSRNVGGSIRRKPTRRGTVKRRYDDEEEEEGYASGDAEDELGDIAKIRVKLHYRDDVRGMALVPDMSWEEFVDRVTSKFGRPLDGLGMQFKDEDGGKVTLRDEMDYELAIETARESAKGRSEGRLEIWCTDE
ncbi:uncharacterized protein FIBRA_06560 [Fibroporia radiculosa]|uniref:PB1 domain-containing protein n=1 Tax=Fibroporia radiculosa TaxID=599839 RepID=J4GSZ5_9APHY|nr:uncharacterized protein FIBRA_06560 [Fibroporia radiculosa]CCM04385.1 predicted protein [Fibroporia radiculosa]